MSVTPSFSDQVQLLEAFLQRELPVRVRGLFAPGSASVGQLMPLATGHERDAPDPSASPAEAFVAARAKLDSVLGHAMGYADMARFDPESVWPEGLLVVEDWVARSTGRSTSTIRTFA